MALMLHDRQLKLHAEFSTCCKLLKCYHQRHFGHGEVSSLMPNVANQTKLPSLK